MQIPQCTLASSRLWSGRTTWRSRCCYIGGWWRSAFVRIASISCMQHFGADQDCPDRMIDLDIQFAVELQQAMGDSLLPPPVLDAYTAAVPQKFVRDATRFGELITALEGVELDLVAFATKSSYGYFDAAQLALLQVATPTEVFVVDAMSPDISKEMWHRLGELPSRSTFVKLCFGYRDEVARLGSFLNLSRNTIAEIVGLGR